MAKPNLKEADELSKLVKSFENFLSVTQAARSQAERDREYTDHKQWSADEEDKLKARGQAPVVVNRVKTKVNMLSGIQRRQRTDPKALPRTPQHEDAADSATDALRFVADNEDFPEKSSEVFENEIVWGYGGVIVEVEERGDQVEVAINEIEPDRFYYDPFSRRKDFSDAKFMGIIIWADRDDALAMFPDKKAEIEGAIDTNTDIVDSNTYADKPMWVDRKRDRIRIAQHYYLKEGVWHIAYFTQQAFLRDPEPSTYLDEFSEPDNPIEMQSAYVDRDNNRYGEVRSYIWVQDEINHRRSKMLYQLSTRQTMGEKGAVDDVNKMKSELAKANGHVEVNQGFSFEILNNNDQTAGQFELYQESKQEIDAIGANAALSGDIPEGTSGRAIQALQQGGIAELGALFDGHANWERRVYRQVWNRIKQFWDEERWIRVTDDEDSLKWVGLNQPLTAGAFLQQRAEEGDEQSAAMLQQLAGDPRLNQVIDVENNVAELDVDIMLTQTQDFANIQNEQFSILAKLAQAYGPEAVPFETMLELSGFPHRKELTDKMKGDPQQEQARMEIQKLFGELEIEKLELANRKTETDVELNVASIEQKRVETQQLALVPADNVNVSV